MIKLACISQKGGVGKTTVSTNLAHNLATQKRVLLIDLDPQNSVANLLLGESYHLLGFYDAMQNSNKSLSESIIQDSNRPFDILPAGKNSFPFLFEYSSEQKEKLLAQFFDRVAMLDYEICLFDTAAGFIATNQEIFTYLSHMIIVEQAEPLSLRSLPKALDFFVYLSNLNPNMCLLGILFTMYQNHLPQVVAEVKEIEKTMGKDLIFHYKIPRTALCVEASAESKLIAEFDPKSQLSYLFSCLAREVMHRINAS